MHRGAGIGRRRHLQKLRDTANGVYLSKLSDPAEWPKDVRSVNVGSSWLAKKLAAFLNWWSKPYK